MSVFKYLEDFLPGRDVNDFLFIVRNIESNEEFTWDILDVLDEINRDRTADWDDYTEDNWSVGWWEWCEGDDYDMLSIEDTRDKIYKPFM